MGLIPALAVPGVDLSVGLIVDLSVGLIVGCCAGSIVSGTEETD